MITKPPDGYCAWHPEHGWLGKEYLFQVRNTFEGAVEELKAVFEIDFEHANSSLDQRVKLGMDFTEWLRANGWQVKPVWLSTTPPMPMTEEEALKRAHSHFACCEVHDDPVSAYMQCWRDMTEKKS